MILDGCGQACPGMPKEAIKTLRTQKLKEVPSWFCTYSFISVKGINWLCRFRWVWSGMHRYALEVWRYKVDFMHATSYLLKLQIDHVVSDGMVRHSQRSFWNLYLKNCWNFKVDFGHLSLGENDHFTLSIDFWWPFECAKCIEVSKRLSRNIFIHSGGYLTTKIINPSTTHLLAP